MSCSLRKWFCDLPWMQQGVLMSAFRNVDGVHQEGPYKTLVRGVRAACIKAAQSKGSFNSRRPTPETLTKAAEDFINYGNELSMHFVTHLMHAAEVIGYAHPSIHVRMTWMNVYFKIVYCLHLTPETVEMFEERLSDDPEQIEREDVHDNICHELNDYGDNTGTKNESL